MGDLGQALLHGGGSRCSQGEEGEHFEPEHVVLALLGSNIPLQPGIEPANIWRSLSKRISCMGAHVPLRKPVCASQPEQRTPPRVRNSREGALGCAGRRWPAPHAKARALPENTLCKKVRCAWGEINFRNEFASRPCFDYEKWHERDVVIHRHADGSPGTVGIRR